MQKYTDDNSVSVDADATSDQPLASEEPVPKKLKLFSFMSTSSQNTHSAGIALTLRQELIEYLCTSTVEYEHDPLEWWKSHGVEFPRAARTAKTVLSIPASSAPVERIFSTAGKIF